MVPRSAAVTIGNAKGTLDREFADETVVDTDVQVDLEKTTDESAVIPAKFDKVI